MKENTLDGLQFGGIASRCCSYKLKSIKQRFLIFFLQYLFERTFFVSFAWQELYQTLAIRFELSTLNNLKIWNRFGHFATINLNSHFLLGSIAFLQRNTWRITFESIKALIWKTQWSVQPGTQVVTGSPRPLQAGQFGRRPTASSLTEARWLLSEFLLPK